MVKKRITIPKGTKDCHGTECQQNLEVDVEIPEATIGVTTIPTAGVSTIPTEATAGPGQTIVLQQPPQLVPPKDEEKKDPHEEMKKSLPTGVNFAKCEGSDCGHKKLKNPKQTSRFKACPDCKFNGVAKHNDFCPNCGLEEESKKFEDWEDSDIEISNEEEENEE